MACSPVPHKVLEEAAGFALPVTWHGDLVTATTDEQLTEILSNAKAVVKYRASWCRGCGQMLTTFCNLRNEHPSSLSVYADTGKCEATTQDVLYTPTAHFYRDGAKVDELSGEGAQRLGIVYGCSP